MQEIREGKQHSFSGGVCGVYSLQDPLAPEKARYVGSSKDIGYRLYSHWHSKNTMKSPTPLSAWIAELRAAGRKPFAKVLKEMPKGTQRVDLELYERFFVDLLECDLNVRLTTVGHLNSKDSSGKKLHAELAALRQEVAALRAENNTLKLQCCNTGAICALIAQGKRPESALHCNVCL